MAIKALHGKMHQLCLPTWLLLQISATNIATILWHAYWKLPFRYVTVDKERLAERGYALERDLELVGELDPTHLTKAMHYGIYSQQVPPS